MKHFFTWLLLAAWAGHAFSQTKISKSYPVKPGQQIELHFDYPKLIRISSWDKDEIAIDASIQINEGENDNAFSLEESTVDGKIFISNKIDMDQIPETYYIMEEGEKLRFPSKADFEQYKKESKASEKRSIYIKKDIEVTMEIKLPARSYAEVMSTYGLVELVNFDAPIKVEAKFGGIDASLSESRIGKIKLSNRFGKIYTNLMLTPTEQKEERFFTSITATPGKGPSYDISSSHGNIYLRKAGE